MITTVVLRKKRQVTIPRHLCEALDVEEEDLLTINIQKVIMGKDNLNKAEKKK